MAYINNIPAAGDLISTSQGQIQANFTAIDSGTTGTGIGFSRNHVTMTDGTNGGLHSRVDYYTAVVSPTISGFVSSVYPKSVTVTTPSSTNTELCYKNAAADIQLTSSALVAANGEGFIGGGLQIRSGSGTSSAAGTVNTFSTQFPTACLSVVICGSNASQANTPKVTAFTPTGFTAKSTIAVSETVWYIATGY